jgi:Amidohydrolase ring-opening protein (Amido_AtzD_TrzD)
LRAPSGCPLFCVYRGIPGPAHRVRPLAGPMAGSSRNPESTLRQRDKACLGSGFGASHRYKSMAYSRGASALSVGVAMGEIAAPVSDDTVLSDWSLASGVASASAGIELKNNIVIVLGNAQEAPLR